MNRKKLSFRLYLAASFLIIGVFFSSLYFHLQKDTLAFHKFSTGFFTSQLKQDTLSMHYSVSHPRNYGIKKYKVLLPCFEKDSYSKQSAALENYLAFLQTVNPDKLKGRDALTYQMLLRSFKQELLFAEYPYYEEPLSPGSGMQSQLPILLAEYSFGRAKDIDDYLALLRAIPQYFESMEAFETIKAEKGLFMPDYSADKIINQCDVIMDSAALEKKSHFLIVTFEERLKRAVDEGLIEEAEAFAYSQENELILKTMVDPAYGRLADSIQLLKEQSESGGGLSSYPEGADYYTSLVRETTGSGKSIAELKILLSKRLQEDLDSMNALAASLNKMENADFQSSFPLSTPEQMLEDLEKRMLTDYPAYPNRADTAYTVKYVDKSLADFVSPAFYLTPPIDNLTENTIYINKQSILDALELYTTLAHEGYPGHLYQSVYYQHYQDSAKELPLRSLLYYGGYSEGWALYVENHSYEYAKEVMLQKIQKPDERKFTELSLDYYRLDKDMRLCLYSLLDIAIHHDGMSYEDIAAILSQFGVKDASVSRSIYEYISEEPTNYLKYYIGYLEILECKEEAKKLWKSAYSEKAFHQFFLESGPMDFTTLRNCLSKTAVPKHLS